jgi:hypothetical protein
VNPPGTGAARAQRKENLLLASRLARTQAVLAVDEIGGRLDAVAHGVERARQWLSDPRVWVAAGAATGLMAVVATRRLRAPWLMRWGWAAWRAWRVAGPLLAKVLAPR